VESLVFDIIRPNTRQLSLLSGCSQDMAPMLYQAKKGKQSNDREMSRELQLFRVVLT
jgi:hypothetical protein